MSFLVLTLRLWVTLVRSLVTTWTSYNNQSILPDFEFWKSFQNLGSIYFKGNQDGYKKGIYFIVTILLGADTERKCQRAEGPKGQKNFVKLLFHIIDIFRTFGLSDRRIVGQSFFGLLAIQTIFVRIIHRTHSFYYEIDKPLNLLWQRRGFKSFTLINWSFVLMFTDSKNFNNIKYSLHTLEIFSWIPKIF